MNVKDTCDEALQILHDSIFAELQRRQHLVVRPDTASMLSLMGDAALDALYEEVGNEEYARAQRAEATAVAHECEQGEARMEAGSVDAMDLFLYRLARTLRLVRLHAPPPHPRGRLEDAPAGGNRPVPRH